MTIGTLFFSASLMSPPSSVLPAERVLAATTIFALLSSEMTSLVPMVYLPDFKASFRTRASTCWSPVAVAGFVFVTIFLQLLWLAHVEVDDARAHGYRETDDDVLGDPF